MSAARQYLKIDCLEIGLENKKWTISDDNEQLDELMLQIQTNQVTGLQKSEGKPIVEANPNHEISKIYLDFANKIKSTYL